MIKEIIERIMGSCKSKSIEKIIDEIDKNLDQRFTLSISEINCEVLIQEFDQHVGTILFLNNRIIINFKDKKYKLDFNDYKKIVDILNKGK